MQGLGFKDRRILLSDMPQNLLCNLAGNAFHAGCCAAALLCHFVVMSRAWAENRQVRRREAVAEAMKKSPHSKEDRVAARDFLDNIMGSVGDEDQAV